MSSASKAFTYINTHGYQKTNLLVEEFLASLFDVEQGMESATIHYRPCNDKPCSKPPTHDLSGRQLSSSKTIIITIKEEENEKTGDYFLADST